MKTTRSKRTLPPPREAGHDAYPLRTVAAMTGLSADVMRAWEKRYRVVAPVRGPRGARLYSAADVAHLRLLGQVVASGRAIGDVAGLGREELMRLIRPQAGEERKADTDAVREGIFEALGRLDAAGVARIVGDALLALGPRRFGDEFAAPLMREVGERWRHGRLCIADEHLLSAVLRNVLTALIHSRPASQRPSLLLCTPAGERHELGLLLFALRALDHGVGIAYLGTDLPADEVAVAARRTGVRVVGLGLCHPASRAEAARQITDLQARLEPNVELWLGGADAQAVAERIPSLRALVLEESAQMDTQLARLRASLA